MTTTSKSPSKKTPANKTAAVCKLLSRPCGATVPELMTATGWQNHSVRAFFTGLRKKERTLVREERSPGVYAYRLLAKASTGAEADNAQPQ